MLPMGPHGTSCIIRQLLPVPTHATSLPGICRRTPRYPHARVSNRHNRSGTSTSTTGKQPPQPTRITKATRPHSQSQHTRPHHRSNQSQSQFRQTHTTTQRSITHSSWGLYPEHRNFSRAHTKHLAIRPSHGLKQPTQPKATIFILKFSITEHNNKMHHYNLT